MRIVHIALLLLLAACAPWAGGGPQDVLILANARSQESLEIANAYRRARGIPYRNLLTLSTSTAFTIGPDIYINEIEAPVRAYLREQGLEEEITTLVLTRGLPHLVNVDSGRSVAMLLATLGAPTRPSRWWSPIPNPYLDMPVAFSHRPDALKGMYLVTSLNGYHAHDALRLVSAALAAEGMAPEGPFVLQTGPALTEARLRLAQRVLATRNMPAKVLATLPAGHDPLMGYVSEGAFSGVTRDALAGLTFRPGAIVDLAQPHGASERNFDDTATPVNLPAGALVAADASGVSAIVAGAAPLGPFHPTWFDRYLAGYSLGESYYAAFAALGNQHLLLGDPLCAPYAQRPMVTIDPGQPPHTGAVPVRITASSPTRGITIGRVDLYLDDMPIAPAYSPEGTRITLRIGDARVVYTVPRGATLRTTLLGLEDAVNAARDLSGPDGVRAVADVRVGALRLMARTAGPEGNEIAVNVSIDHERGETPRVVARLESEHLTDGGAKPTAARATLSFVGRRARPGDVVTLQVLHEHLTYTVTDADASLSGICDNLVKLVEGSAVLRGERGVRAFRDPGGLPVVVLESRQRGEVGNLAPFTLAVTPVADSSLRGYPDTPSQLDGGRDGSEARTAAFFVLGEYSTQSIYMLDTAGLADGYHRLRAVAYDGSLAQVQGWAEASIVLANQDNAPLVGLPDRIGPAVGEALVPVDGDAQRVARVELYVDGQRVAAADGPSPTLRVPLATLGRGTHDLWAVGISADGRRSATAPIPLEVLAPPELRRVSVDHGVIAGGSAVRVIGASFQEGCQVSLAGVAPRTVTLVSPNILDCITAPGTAGRGDVRVVNPDGTAAVLRNAFEYYAPKLKGLTLTPARDVLGLQRSATMAATRGVDQFGEPYAPKLEWQAKGGGITAAGRYTAPAKAGTYTARVREVGSDRWWEIPVAVGPMPVADGYLRDWLVLGPFADEKDDQLLAATFPNEDAQRPTHDESTGGHTWRMLPGDRDGYVNFLTAFPERQTAAVCYAHVYVIAHEDTDAVLLFGSDDGIRIWLNGQVIHTAKTRRSCNPSETRLPVHLAAGVNRLLVKVDQGTGFWGLSMRALTDKGEPIPGLTYALDR